MLNEMSPRKWINRINSPWMEKEPELNLMQFIVKLAEETKYEGKLEDLTDDVLIYHLKMRNSEKQKWSQVLLKTKKMILKPQF